MSLEPAVDVAKPLDGAANTFLQQGVLGAMVLVLIVALAFAVWRWNKANEARVKDQKEMRDTILEVTRSFEETTRELSGSVDKMAEATRAQTASLVTMERTLNETVRDAIRVIGFRRNSPFGGTPAQGGGGSGSRG